MVPQKLSWITIPLIVHLVLGVLTLLMLPFLGGLINLALGSSTESAQDVAFARIFTGATLWITGLITVLWLVFEYLTLKAVQAGKSWGRVAAVVIAVIGILNFPVGTLLGIFMLIGAFDPDVQRYASR